MSIRRSNLLGQYAFFLETVRRRYDLADRFYQRALAVNPQNARIMRLYAGFLEMRLEAWDLAEAYYERALRIDPENPALLGNYAEFRASIRQDYDRAEALYVQAMRASPSHVNNLQNYATFLSEVRSRHDQAEALYEQALALDPLDRFTLFHYAVFLTDIRGELAEAEGLYRRGLLVAPHNPAMHANLIGLLLLQGKEEEGLARLDEALGRPVPDDSLPDVLECWFYALLYRKPEFHREALVQIRGLLERGVYSPGFNLAPHVAGVRAMGHPLGEWLEPLAAVITGNAPTAVLEPWALWAQGLPT